MHRSGSLGWAWATAVPQILVRILTIDVPIVKLHGFFVTPCNGDDTSMSMRKRFDPLRRKRLERDKLELFQGQFFKSWIMR